MTPGGVGGEGGRRVDAQRLAPAVRVLAGNKSLELWSMCAQATRELTGTGFGTVPSQGTEKCCSPTVGARGAVSSAQRASGLVGASLSIFVRQGSSAIWSMPGSEELTPAYILYDEHLCRDAMLSVTLMTLVRPSGPVVPAGHRTEVWKRRGTTSDQPITPILTAPIHQIVNALH